VARAPLAVKAQNGQAARAGFILSPKGRKPLTPGRGSCPLAVKAQNGQAARAGFILSPMGRNPLTSTLSPMGRGKGEG